MLVDMFLFIVVLSKFNVCLFSVPVPITFMIIPGVNCVVIFLFTVFSFPLTAFLVLPTSCGERKPIPPDLVSFPAPPPPPAPRPLSPTASSPPHPLVPGSISRPDAGKPFKTLKRPDKRRLPPPQPPLLPLPSLLGPTPSTPRKKQHRLRRPQLLLVLAARVRVAHLPRVSSPALLPRRLALSAR